MDMNFDRQIDRRGTDSYKWDDNQKLFGRRDLLPFWVADMDFATPAPIFDAIRSRCEHPVLGYGIRSDSYFEALEDWLKRRHGWDVPREWMMFCPPSSIVGIHGVISLLTEPGDSILVPMPTYGPLIGLVVDNQRCILECPVREDDDGRFHLDIADMESRIKDNTKMVVFCSPHNPVGRLWTRDELERIGNICVENNVIINKYIRINV